MDIVSVAVVVVMKATMVQATMMVMRAIAATLTTSMVFVMTEVVTTRMMMIMMTAIRLIMVMVVVVVAVELMMATRVLTRLQTQFNILTTSAHLILVVMQDTKGFMLQVEEQDGLGDGQKLETELAREAFPVINE